MRQILIIILISALALMLQCRKSTTGTNGVQFSGRVYVTDTSFVTRTICDTVLVEGAKVELSAVSYDLSYEAYTNDSGYAEFNNLVPDIYNCSVIKAYPADTVSLYLPVRQDINLVGSVAARQLSREGDSIAVLLRPVFRSNVLISEIYYNGAPPNPPYYFHDQFTEIYNNSEDTVYMDNYAVGDVDYGYRDEDPDYLHCIHLYKFPGGGRDYPLPPGEIFIIAQDAIDHTQINVNSIDLSFADFEYYNHLSTDVDIEGVKNMVQIHHKYGHDFLYSVFNDAVVLFKLEESDSNWTYDTFNHILVPIERVIDGVEYRENKSEYQYKRLHDNIDAGITGGIPAYKGKSVARKIFKNIDDQIILMDNNNSSIDFKVLDKATPGLIE